MGRKRDPTREGWPVGLDRDERTGIFRMRRGNSTQSLKTRDEALAIKRFSVLASRGDEVAQRGMFPRFLEHFCNELLDELVALKGPRKGKPLSGHAKQQYRQYLGHPDVGTQTSPLNKPLRSIKAEDLRQYLARFEGKPTAHNRALESFSRALRHAVKLGMCPTNVARDVERDVQPERQLALDAHELVRRIMAELPYEWLRVSFSLSYLLGCRPGELVTLLDADCDDVRVVRTALKTGDRVGIRLDDEIRRHVAWLRKWKRENGLRSPHLICQPAAILHARGKGLKKNRNAGKPIARRAMQGWWAQARTDAGVKVQITVADLRPLSLTDEAEARDGLPTHKGGQRSEQIRQRYVRRRLVVDERNSLPGLWQPDEGEGDSNVIELGERRGTGT